MVDCAARRVASWISGAGQVHSFVSAHDRLGSMALLACIVVLAFPVCSCVTGVRPEKRACEPDMDLRMVRSWATSRTSLGVGISSFGK